MKIDVLLIHPQYHRRRGSGVIPPLGLAYIAAALESHGFTVAILDCALDCDSQTAEGLAHFRAYLDQQLPQFHPTTCVGVGPTTTPALKSLVVLAEALQHHYPELPLVYGGPFASIPEQAPIFFEQLGATALMRGEGEETFPKLARALQAGAIAAPIESVMWQPHQVVLAAVSQNINAIRFPARHLLANHRYRPSLRRDIFNGPITPLYGSRGCPYRCSFCVSPTLRNNRYYRRSLENLFAEMRQCVTQFGITGFIFYDDCLFLKSTQINAEVQDFCQGLLTAVGEVRWQMELRGDAIAALSPESLHWLYRAGCRQINVGIEKAANLSLQTLQKQLQVDEVVQACRQVKAAVPELRLAGTFILGGAGETEVDVATTIEFARSLPLDYAHFNPLMLYPGTALFTEYFGADVSPTAWADAILNDPDNVLGEIIYESPELPAQRLLDLTQQAYEMFYDQRHWSPPVTENQDTRQPVAIEKTTQQWRRDRFQLLSSESALPSPSS
ncbi:MAG: B12-binding domain-containing radical SAM protein [Spirulinaceae cyanobacterium]